MSLDQLRYFVAVAEEQHVGRAALRLHISQPPLSRQIHRLEEELGTPLFQRTPRGMRLLPAGVALLPRAQGVLRAVADAAEATLAAASIPSADVNADPTDCGEKSPTEREPKLRPSAKRRIVT